LQQLFAHKKNNLTPCSHTNQGEELVNNIIQLHVMLHLANERANEQVISTCLQDATITCHLQETSLDKEKKP
jgi:hypothetical protein